MSCYLCLLALAWESKRRIAHFLTDCGVLTRCDCLAGRPRRHVVSDQISLQNVDPTGCITFEADAGCALASLGFVPTSEHVSMRPSISTCPASTRLHSTPRRIHHSSRRSQFLSPRGIVPDQA